MWQNKLIMCFFACDDLSAAYILVAIIAATFKMIFVQALWLD